MGVSVAVADAVNSRASRGLSRLAVLAACLLTAGCEWPSYNPVKLHAIKSESERLIATHPIKSPERWQEIPESEWPPAIASLHPDVVVVYSWGLDILIKPYFDGGWGYMIAKRKEDLPLPGECVSEPGEGVFWHGPC